MTTTHTFSVLFWLKQASTKNGQAPLYARITVNGQRAELSLKQKISIADWDSSKVRIRGKSTTAKQINNYIQQVGAKLFDIYQDIKSKQELITAKRIKAEI